ncbi:MAG: M15 family metallopeptidase [Actinobacteria bacterium]|nr:M15 family metallopeptidase [Actinomycetota bacterium]MCG2799137.1 M15 family metallopeptidase [Cellulomonas sp.]
MTRRATATAAALAALLTVALLGDGERWTARTAVAAHEQATQEAGQAVRALAADATGAGSLGAAQSAGAALTLVTTARTNLAAELDAARSALAADTVTPGEPRAALEAETEAAAAIGASASPASLAAATARVHAARAALAAAQETATDQTSDSPAVETVTEAAPPAQSCATTYTGPPFYTSAPTADGDGSNGHLPASAMTALSWSVDDLGTPFYLRSDAAAALERLNTAFTAEFGHPLGLDLTYRDYDTQVAMRAALGTIAAEPGTSTHGTGLAIDLPELPCSYGWDTPARDWLLQHGADYGWVSPSWARASGSNPEYWHYEYRG